MRVQHPDKTQYTIAPAGEDPIVTDDRGIADVPAAVGKNLVKQGWTELKSSKSDSEKE